MKTYFLYVDESGSSFPAFQKSYPYILTGVVVEQSKQAELLDTFDDLKQKYLGKKNVVLHSEDIGKNINDFSIFKNNSQLKTQFIDELLECIRKAPFMSFHAIVDKARISDTWKEETVVRKTARSVFYDFLCYLLTRPEGSKGKLIVEASTAYKDSEYLKAFTFFLGPNCTMLDNDFPPYNQIRNILSQITFVTKMNHDIETQLADILSYAAYCKFRQQGGAGYSQNSYAQKLINVLDAKQFTIPPTTGAQKRLFYSKIDSFKIFSR